MDFKISRNSNHLHFFDIECRYKSNSKCETLQFPAWRPGRYELQNFSKNIQYLYLFDTSGNKLLAEKSTKDTFLLHTDNQEVVIKYNYYAAKQDAGNSYVDDTIFYVNFVNCIPYIVGKISDSVTVTLHMNIPWGFACNLPSEIDSKSIKIFAESFYQLYDAPFFAGKAIQKREYFTNNTKFIVNFCGNFAPNWSKILPAFKAFTMLQIDKMGDFPVQEFHFIIWILPTAFYHGVEHGGSTMIVLGPDIEGDNLLSDIFGVSSHELFHAWNICKIRPKQLLPYDFTKETFFDTGFVVEGVTTYLGDLFLVQSGVISELEYFKEISAICIRHFVGNSGAKQSLVESSIDLWMDGYGQGTPQKKVSIYYKGAIVAMILDLMIRIETQHQASLMSVMKIMWEKFGKTNKGYLLIDYKLIAESVFGGFLDEYFETCIFGNVPLVPYFNKYLHKFGLNLLKQNEDSVIIHLIEKPNKYQVYNKKMLFNL